MDQHGGRRSNAPANAAWEMCPLDRRWSARQRGDARHETMLRGRTSGPQPMAENGNVALDWNRPPCVDVRASRRRQKRYLDRTACRSNAAAGTPPDPTAAFERCSRLSREGTSFFRSPPEDTGQALAIRASTKPRGGADILLESEPVDCREFKARLGRRAAGGGDLAPGLRSNWV